MDINTNRYNACQIDKYMGRKTDRKIVGQTQKQIDKIIKEYKNCF